MLWQFTKVERQIIELLKVTARRSICLSFEFACCLCREGNSVQSVENSDVYSRARNNNNC